MSSFILAFPHCMHCKDRKCHLIVDENSCENVVLQEVVNKLKFLIEKHQTPQQSLLVQVHKRGTITIRGLVSFSIAGH